MSVFLCSVLSTWWPHIATAQQSPAVAAPNAPAPEPFGIIDNSFLVEESFNQEAGTFQNIFTMIRSHGIWAATFVQEWPIVTDNHQFSYALAWDVAHSDAAFGDALVNYRFQAIREAPGKPAFAPRLSAVLPTATGGEGRSWGVQINLPFSKRAGRVYWHWNAGLTWLRSSDPGSDSVSLESPFLAGSAVYRLAPMLQPVLEAVANFDEERFGGGTDRTRSLTVSPGLRGGWDIGKQQVVFGLAVPTTWSSAEHRDVAALFYASYELPFKR